MLRSRQIPIVVVPVNENGIFVVPHKGQRRARVGPMAHRGACLVQVLLARDDAPLVGHMVADGPGIGEVGLDLGTG